MILLRHKFWGSLINLSYFNNNFALTHCVTMKEIMTRTRAMLYNFEQGKRKIKEIINYELSTKTYLTSMKFSNTLTEFSTLLFHKYTVYYHVG